MAGASFRENDWGGVNARGKPGLPEGNELHGTSKEADLGEHIGLPASWAHGTWLGGRSVLTGKVRSQIFNLMTGAQ